MTKLIKKVALLLSCVMIVSVLAGWNYPVDASDYTKAWLDVLYKNDPTSFVQLNMGTEQEAVAAYQEKLDSEMAYLIGTGELNEQQEQEYRQIMAYMLASVRYTVGEAQLQEDGSYIVAVAYEQMNVFGPTMEICINQIDSQFDLWFASNSQMPTDEELINYVIDLLQNCLVITMTNVTYDEPAATTIRLELQDNVYTPNLEDLTKLESLLFDVDAM